MIYKVKSGIEKKAIESQLVEKAKEVGFGVLGSYDFKTILEGKGFPIEREITVYELCNPAGAQAALSILPEISVYLPCRLSVYEEGGETILATIGFESILASVEVDPALQEHFETLFAKLKSLMNAWC